LCKEKGINPMDAPEKTDTTFEKIINTLTNPGLAAMAGSHDSSHNNRKQPSDLLNAAAGQNNGF